ncbi:MAG TPA: PfkB family carbohydrate kinase, partial [Candidatus Limnocylindria bacterium]|nr:PfkB family carbohydrate kinase [Candidatus Limnocylindria bacterium]
EERCRALGIALHALPAEATTTFAFRYEDGTRILRLRARARAIGIAEVPAALRSSDAVVLGPVAHEIDASLLGAFGDAAVVVTAQGYLREWSADGTIRPRRWDDVGEVVASASAVVLSEEDVAGELDEPRRWAGHVPVIVTFAERGALVIDGGTETLVPAYRADRVVDPTGAGDAFAAGLAIALAEHRTLLEAARFANAVASFAVEAVGTEGLADRNGIESRMSTGAERD